MKGNEIALSRIEDLEHRGKGFVGIPLAFQITEVIFVDILFDFENTMFVFATEISWRFCGYAGVRSVKGI